MGGYTERNERLKTNLEQFLQDPPDSDFQRGYLAAMQAEYRITCCNGERDALYLECEQLPFVNVEAD